MIIYNLLFRLYARPLVRKLRRAAKAGDAAAQAELDERQGRAPTGQHRGAVLWLHGASLGELTGARRLIQSALARDPKLHIVVTANSATGREMVANWDLPRVSARFAPLDDPKSVTAFLAGWTPDALISIENEIWPERFRACAARGIPVFMVGARVSESSARVWRFLPRLRKRLIGSLASLSAHDAESEVRYLALGLPESKLAPRVNLKSGVDLMPPNATDLQTLHAVFDHETTILAASTHPGEEELILSAFVQSGGPAKGWRLILAPRHPARAGDVRAAIAASGLPCAQRSAGDDPTSAPVYLADTLGEMALWYALAGTSFIGGSLVDLGGHTPFEPVQFGTAIIHGPHLGNHAEAYAAMAHAGGSLQVTGVDNLARAFSALVPAKARRRAMTHAATDALDRLRADDPGIETLLDRIGHLSGNPDLARGPINGKSV